MVTAFLHKTAQKADETLKTISTHTIHIKNEAKNQKTDMLVASYLPLCYNLIRIN